MKKLMFVTVLLFACSAMATTEVKPHKVVTYTDVPFETVSFEKNVKPIVQNRCAACHTGTNGLLNLLDYSVAKDNGSKIRSNMISGRMPLRNLTGISDYERFVIRAWVDKGMKE
jgi:uncharacterized membrane protein